MKKRVKNLNHTMQQETYNGSRLIVEVVINYDNPKIERGFSRSIKHLHSIDDLTETIKKFASKKGIRNLKFRVSSEIILLNTIYDVEQSSNTSKKIKNDDADASDIGDQMLTEPNHATNIVINTIFDALEKGIVSSASSSSSSSSSSIEYVIPDLKVEFYNTHVVHRNIYDRIGMYLHKSKHLKDFGMFVKDGVPYNLYKECILMRLIGTTTINNVYINFNLTVPNNEYVEDIVNVLDKSSIINMTFLLRVTDEVIKSVGPRLAHCESLRFKNILSQKLNVLQSLYMSMTENIMKNVIGFIKFYGMSSIKDINLIFYYKISLDVLNEFFELIASQDNVNLRKLKFSGKHVDNDFIEILLTHLKYNTNITELSFGSSGFSTATTTGHMDELINLPINTHITSMTFPNEVTLTGEQREQLKNNLELGLDSREVLIYSTSKSAAKIS